MSSKPVAVTLLYIGTICLLASSTYGQTQTCNGIVISQDGGQCGVRVGNNQLVCRVGSYCQAGTCTPSKVLNDECISDADCQGFPQQTICYSGHCQALFSPGDRCVANRQCQGQVCSNGVCTGIAVGSGCAASENINPCVQGAYCSGGTCRTQGQTGASCDPQALDSCANAGVCSPKNRVCGTGFNRLKDSPCESGRDCAYGLTCVSFKCQPVAEGSPCSVTTDCNPSTQQCQCNSATSGTCQNVLNNGCQDQFLSLYACAQRSNCPLSDFEDSVISITEQPGACLNLNCQAAFESFACCANGGSKVHRFPQRVDCDSGSNNTLIIVIVVVAVMFLLAAVGAIVAFVIWKKNERLSDPLALSELHGIEKTTVKTNYFGHEIEYDAYITKD